MSKKFTELRFEEWIEKSLLDNGYTHSFTHSNENEGRYEKDLCLVAEDVIGFIKDTNLRSTRNSKPNSILQRIPRS